MNDLSTQPFEEYAKMQLELIRKSVENIQKVLDDVDSKSNIIMEYTSESSKAMASLSYSITETNKTFTNVGVRMEAAVDRLSSVISNNLDGSQRATIDAYKASVGLLSPRLFMWVGGFVVTILSIAVGATNYYAGEKAERGAKESAAVIASTIREEFVESRIAADTRTNKLIDAQKVEGDNGVKARNK